MVQTEPQIDNLFFLYSRTSCKHEIVLSWFAELFSRTSLGSQLIHVNQQRIGYQTLASLKKLWILTVGKYFQLGAC